ncbi:MAM and LDL-receptor class A domain-containing protein 1-like [Hydractinia symbiolongicarpus]|uniref:MAM and LDL-receptor class A domain-containing protein 1-like n=1 Tax=Hydractinia symbiolongicarpus TaxID=13093 RepID=UPI00254D564F|nr:MAM and LDL-receptor class A domain-containing protein 1-like [Hydractinia symbiolongicarpus]
MKRPDRDRYVNIMWENVKDDKHSQYERYHEDWSVTFDFSYDYNSIMHYTPYAFSKSKDKPTILPTDPTMSYKSLGGDKPTEMDYFKLNLLYECKNKHSPVSSWSVWGACIKQYDGQYMAIRQRFCSRENVSECWTDNNRVETEKRTCDINYEVRKNLTLGAWNKWSTWSICNTTNERIFHDQRRTRKCEVGRRCSGSDTQSRSCRTDGDVRNDKLDCSFKTGYCLWCAVRPIKEYRWRAKTGKGEVLRDGPLFDHTTMGDSGYFLKAVISGNAKGEDRAIFRMKVPANPRDTCLTFWYYMTGSENHALIAMIGLREGKPIETCQKRLELTTTTSSGEDWWIPAQINHNCGKDNYEVYFIARNGGDKFSNIAIDDIFFLDGYRDTDVDSRPLQMD